MKKNLLALVLVSTLGTVIANPGDQEKVKVTPEATIVANYFTTLRDAAIRCQLATNNPGDTGMRGQCERLRAEAVHLRETHPVVVAEAARRVDPNAFTLTPAATPQPEAWGSWGLRITKDEFGKAAASWAFDKMLGASKGGQ